MSSSHQKTLQTFAMRKFFYCLVYFSFLCIESIQPFNNFISFDDNHTQLGVQKMVSVVSSVINNLSLHKPTVNILENPISTDTNFLNSVLKTASKDFRVAMTVSDRLLTSRNELKFSNVIVLDETKLIRIFFRNFLSSRFDFRSHYLLVVLEKVDEEAFDGLLQVLRKLHIINFSAIHGDKVSTFVSSFVPFEGKVYNKRVDFKT